MATTLKTFIVDAKHEATEADAIWSDIATFVGAYVAASVVDIETTPLMGDRVMILVTKTVA